MLSYQQFKERRYFPELDGLRAISVAMVLAVHTHDPVWNPVNGYLGVTIFFVISGLLITTLLLREEEGNKGSVSIWRFYVRRVFRIFPLYYLALAVFTLLVLGLGFGNDPAEYAKRLPLLATYNGEFAGAGTFSHSWSLGIEEKFYLLWPILGFGLLWFRQRRLFVGIALLLLTTIGAFFSPLAYFGIYIPIAAGCVNGDLDERPIHLPISRAVTPSIGDGIAGSCCGV